MQPFQVYVPPGFDSTHVASRNMARNEKATKSFILYLILENHTEIEPTMKKSKNFKGEFLGFCGSVFPGHRSTLTKSSAPLRTL